MPLTKKQLKRVTTVENALKTWEKHKDENSYNYQKYEQIKLLAQEQGILTKSGKISKAKSKQKNVESFYKQYKSQFGSYTKFKKERKQKFKEFKSEHDEYISFNEFEDLSNQLNEIVDEMFANIPSQSALDVFELYNDEPIQERINKYKQFMEEQGEEANTNYINLDEAFI